MTRLTRIVCVVALVVAGLAFGGNASAEPSITATNCNQYSGSGIFPRSANHIRIDGDGTAVGAVQLCKSSTSYYWGYVVFVVALPSGKWGQAYMHRYRNGTHIATYSCDTLPQGPPSGGNGWVQPTQTQCWTPKIYAPSTSDTFQVLGLLCSLPHPSCRWNAWGYTAEVH
jgi:hypothetical protein